MVTDDVRVGDGTLNKAKSSKLMAPISPGNQKSTWNKAQPSQAVDLLGLNLKEFSDIEASNASHHGEGRVPFG
jgi:hypothetical protein